MDENNKERIEIKSDWEKQQRKQVFYSTSLLITFC